MNVLHYINNWLYVEGVSLVSIYVINTIIVQGVYINVGKVVRTLCC